MCQIYQLKDMPEHFESAVRLFWSEWGTDRNYKFYEDCMLHSMNAQSDLPRFYIAIQQDAIIGTYALLRNDLISRQDLFPWLACLYVVPERRGQRIGAELLRHALRETKRKGHDNLYLCTDLEGYYEKLGWSRVASGYGLTGDPTNIYSAAAATNSSLLPEYEIRSIKDCPERSEEFKAYLSKAWSPVSNTAIAQMNKSLATPNALPLTFLLMHNDRIMGFYQLIEQESLVQKDLSPWIAPLFIDESLRERGLGAALLLHARRTAGRIGYSKVFLTTDHIGYYEKHGFREIGLSTFEWGRPSKIYEHDVLT